MAADHQVAADILKAKQNGGTIRSDSIVAYKTRYELADLPLDGHITKYLFQAIIPPPGLGFKEPFTGITGKTIDWQSDIPTGQTSTYATLMGNNFPHPFIYTGASPNWTKTDVTITVVTSGIGDSQVDTVVLDWGFSSNGIIQW